MRTINLLLCFLIAHSLFAKAPSYGTTIGSVEEERKDKETTSKSKFTISGNITDLLSGETLIGANIYTMDTGEGTSTNEYGFYSLTVSEGNLSIRYSYIGYESQVITINLSENREQNVKLNPSQQLNEVVVYGDRSETGINSTHMGAVDIPMDVLKSAPSLLGEADIMKAVQMMPGVQTGTEGSAGVHVRGGGADENLILLDGVPIYNINHLFGFFSAFTPEAIKKVSLFKSSFPARFGGRLSSVIDVRTNDGNMHEYHGSIGIGLLSSKIQLEGPIVKGRTSFNVSARRSYMDLIAKPFMSNDEMFGYYFYDLNAKINHRFSDRSRLFVSVYNGSDKMDTEFNDIGTDFVYKDKVGMQWGNLLTSAKWNFHITPKLFSNATVAYTNYKFNVGSKFVDQSISQKHESNYNSDYTSGIKDLTFNLDFDYHPSPNHQIKFGGGYLNHQFRPEVQTARIKNNEDGVNTDTTYYNMSNSNIRAHEASLYLEDNMSIGNRFSANVGFHLSLFNVANKTYTSFQPRVSTRYKFTDDISAKASYTNMSQYIHLLSNNAISLPTDLWVPTTDKIKPMQVHQYSIGGYYTGIKGYELSVEGYYKDMSNVLEYKDGTSFMGSSESWEDKVEMGKGKAMGLEFMLQKTTGPTTGWIAYTLAKSDRKFAEGGINNGKAFPYKYDRRHHINLVANHKFSEKIDVSASWEFYTGGATTIAEEKTIIIRPDQDGSISSGSITEADYIDNRNNYRMPNSHLLSLGVNFNKKTKRGMRTWNVSVYNVYNSMNPAFIYRGTKEGENGVNEETILKKMTIFPIIPSVSYIYKF